MADDRNFPDINFVDTDTERIKESLVQAYELMTGRTLYPADPARLFILWVADIIGQVLVLINESAKQNVPRYAEGDYLDSIAEIFKDAQRLGAKEATTTLRFVISEPQAGETIIPIGTRVTTTDGGIIFATSEVGRIEAGKTTADVPAACLTAGSAGNGFLAGQIATPVDWFPYMQSVANITTSEGGAERETDEAFYNRMRESMESYSTAGPAGAYEYIAKSVNPLISDVKAVSEQETITRTLEVNGGKAYKGGDQLLPDTLVVYPHGASAAATLTTDYTFTYEDGLLTISIVEGGTLAAETSVDISISQKMAGRVKVYVLLADGELPGTEILTQVEAALNDQKPRPLTDLVNVMAPNTVDFDIELTYYIPSPSEASATKIQAEVENAVEQYKKWQTSRMARDINPSYLNFLLMQTGIKRVEIIKPQHQAVSSGEVAKVGTQTIVNGGVEDE